MMEPKDTPDWSTTEWSPALLMSILVALLHELDWKVPKVPDMSKGLVRVIRPGEPSHRKYLSRELSRKLSPIANSLLQKWTVLEHDLLHMIEEENAQLRKDLKEANYRRAQSIKQLANKISELSKFKADLDESIRAIRNDKHRISMAEGVARAEGYSKGWIEGSDRMLAVCMEKYKHDGY